MIRMPAHSSSSYPLRSTVTRQAMKMGHMETVRMLKTFATRRYLVGWRKKFGLFIRCLPCIVKKANSGNHHKEKFIRKRESLSIFLSPLLLVDLLACRGSDRRTRKKKKVKEKKGREEADTAHFSNPYSSEKLYFAGNIFYL